MIFVYFLTVYFLIGLICAVVFFFVGYKVVLADATDSDLSVRLLWLPGAVAIWPLLVLKWCCQRGCQWLSCATKATQKN